MATRVLKQLMVLLMITAGFLLTGSASCFAQQRRAISAGPAKALPFSDGMLVGNTLYIARPEGTDDQGKLKTGGIGPETQAALANSEKVINAAGFEVKDVVAGTAYTASIHALAETNH